MKQIWIFILFLILPVKAIANPACIVCTVAIGASLKIAQKMGIQDNIVGLWAGAFLALLGVWAIYGFDKKNWHFKGRNTLLIGLCLSSIGFMYWKNLVYRPQIIGFLYIDSFLLSALIGASLYFLSQRLYLWMKHNNHNHAHFPFEKVALTIGFLLMGSFVLTIYPLS